MKRMIPYLLLAAAFLACGDSTGTDSDSDPESIATGAWTGTTGSGLTFDFTVGAGAAEITQIVYRFSGLQCGGVTLSSGSITSSRTPGWPISNRQFEIARTGDPPITISGTFASNGTTASGNWDWLTCSGTWTGSH